MKKALTLSLVLLMVLTVAFTAAGCGNKGVTEESAQKLADKYEEVAAKITELMDLANTYGVDETNAANLNALKDAVAEVGTLIGDSASTLKEEEVEPLLEQLQTLGDTMDPYYNLFQ